MEKVTAGLPKSKGGNGDTSPAKQKLHLVFRTWHTQPGTPLGRPFKLAPTLMASLLSDGLADFVGFAWPYRRFVQASTLRPLLDPCTSVSPTIPVPVSQQGLHPGDS